MIDLSNPQETATDVQGRRLTTLESYRSGVDAPGRDGGIGSLLGLRMTSIEPGAATFELTTGPEHSNTLGIVHGGVAATMLDSAMACAIHTMLGAEDEFVTVELKVNYIRPANVSGEVLTARGTVLHVGGSTGVADGQIRNNDGGLIAHATTTCLIRRAGTT